MIVPMKGLHGGRGDTVGEVAICLRTCSVGRGGCHQRQRALVADVDDDLPEGHRRAALSRPGIEMPSISVVTARADDGQQGRTLGRAADQVDDHVGAVSDAVPACRGRQPPSSPDVDPTGMKDLPRPVTGRTREQGGGAWG
jgi:hypothetical protein